MNGLGILRAALVAAAGTALVVGAGRADTQVDLSRASDTTAAPPVASMALTRSELVCPGPHRDGQQVQLLTASLPTELLPTAAQTPGTDQPGTDQPGTGQPGTGQPGTGQISAARLPGPAAAPPVVGARGGTRAAQVGGGAAIDLVGSGQLAAGLAGLQVSDDRTPTAHGLGMLSCRTPTATSYLVGGGAEPGRLEHLVLTNPSPNPVVARVSVLGSTQQQELTVPGRSRVVTLLGAVDDTAVDPVVAVTATSGTLAVAMSDLALDGTRPVGAELVGPSLTPRTRAVIPAVVTGERVVVRVGVPGAEDAVVRVRLIGGAATMPDQVRTVPAGSTGALTLPDVPSGRYALAVESDVPVVAAAESRRSQSPGGPADTAWVPTAEPITGVAGTPVPSGPGLRSVLMLTAPQASGRVTVGLTNASGSTTIREVAVPTGGSVSVPGDQASAVWVRSTAGPVYGALVVAGRDDKNVPLLAATPLAPLPTTAKPINAREALPR